MWNRFMCWINEHKLNPWIASYDPYTGQDYVYCVRCKAYVPMHNLD